MKIRSLKLVAGILACIGSSIVPANAETIGLLVGGIDIARSDAIVISRMDMFVSQDEVRIDYTLRNDRYAFIKTRMSFLQPNIKGRPFALFDVPVGGVANFMGFSLAIDGQEVMPELEQRAIAQGIDVTNDLNTLGYQPLVPYGSKIEAAIENTYATIIEELLADGIVAEYYDNDLRGSAILLSPAWELQSTYFWDVTFEPGAEMVVSVRYLSSVGERSNVSFVAGSNNMFSQYAWDDLDEKYCVGQSKWADMELLNKTVADQYSAQTMVFEFSDMRYDAPIGEFNLRVEAPSVDYKIGLCAEHFNRTDPGVYELKAIDYRPPERLEFYFLENGHE